MSTHNLCFYGEISKISQNYQIIKYPGLNLSVLLKIIGMEVLVYVLIVMTKSSVCLICIWSAHLLNIRANRCSEFSRMSWKCCTC